MKYDIRIRDVVWEDLEEIPTNLQKRILRAIEQRLVTNPTHYGVKLRQALTGLWKIRVGDYRIVYEIKDRQVNIWAICHRKFIYSEVQRRWIR